MFPKESQLDAWALIGRNARADRQPDNRPPSRRLASAWDMIRSTAPTRPSVPCASGRSRALEVLHNRRGHDRDLAEIDLAAGSVDREDVTLLYEHAV